MFVWLCFHTMDVNNKGICLFWNDILPVSIPLCRLYQLQVRCYLLSVALTMIHTGKKKNGKKRRMNKKIYTCMKGTEVQSSCNRSTCICWAIIPGLTFKLANGVVQIRERGLWAASVLNYRFQSHWDGGGGSKGHGEELIACRCTLYWQKIHKLTMSRHWLSNILYEHFHNSSQAQL